jgi:hypothetical protein
VAAAALCAVAAVSLASAPGCSETEELSDRLSKAQYLLQLRQVVREVRVTLRVGERLLDVSSVDQLTRLVNRTVAQYKAIVARMESIEPPEEVADLHYSLTVTLAELEGVLEDANDSLQAGDLAALLGLATEVQRLAEDFGDLTLDYAERGYELDTGGGGK